MWLVTGACHAALYTYPLEVLKSNSNISHAKATRELGYRPRPLHDSIRDAIGWFLEKKDG
jgi:dihydroflavonol-4-reductase